MRQLLSQTATSSQFLEYRSVFNPVVLVLNDVCETSQQNWTRELLRQTLEDKDEGKMRDSPCYTKHDLSLL